MRVRFSARPRGARPLSAVDLQRALEADDRDLALSSGAGARLSDYAPWIAPYLHFYSAALDQRVEPQERDPRRLLLVPSGEAPPRVFQRRHPIAGAEYTHRVQEFYPVPE